MKTLVTGGSGFIGSAVVLELLRREREVRALVRSRNQPGNLRGLNVELVEGDVLNPDSLRHAVDGCDQVYHLAANYTNWYPKPDLLYRVNVDGTRNLLSICQEFSSPPRIVYTSSVAAFGAHGPTPANESAEFNMGDIEDHYYLSKNRAERVAEEFAANGLPVIIVNPSNPVGPRDIKPTPTGALIVSVMKRQLPGYVDGGINIVDVDDVAVGHVKAMECGWPGEKYILGNTNVSIKEYVRLIAEVAGVPAPKLQIPQALAMSTAYGYETIARLTGKPPITTVSWVKVGSHYSFWDSSKAVRELGLPQTPVRASLERAVAWFRKNKYA